MTGFEAIGVVVGVWPVVVNALALHAATKRGRRANSLLLKLRAEEVVYREFVYTLLSADVPEADLCQLSGRPIPNLHLWKDKALHTKLAMRLGGVKTKRILDTVEEMHKCLAALETMSEINDPLAKTSSNTVGNNIRKLFKNLPADYSSFKQGLEDLGALNDRLQRLLAKHATSGSSFQKMQLAPRSFPPKFLLETSAYANDLYNAIQNGYRCNCTFPHQVCLGLGQFVPSHIHDIKPVELLFSVDERATTEIPKLGDDFLSPRIEQQDQVSIAERNSDLENDKLDDDLCTFTKKINNDLPVHAPASFLHKLAPRDKKVPTTTRLWHTRGSLSTPRSLSPGRSLSTGRSWSTNTSVSTTFSVASSSMVCLDDYLPPHQSWGISRQERVNLAVSLSNAILIFYSTPWIDTWWTWKDFYTSRDNISRIFLTKAFYGNHDASLKGLPQSSSRSKSKSLLWEIIGEPVLSRLGFALIELALGKRLCELRAKDIHPIDPDICEDILDMITAKRILSEGYVLEETGQGYHDAVEACLTHQVTIDSGLKSLNSNHPSFRQDLERFVVAPIMHFRAATWEQFSSSDDFEEETYKGSMQLDFNFNLLLGGNGPAIELDWITFEWELPEIIYSICRQGEGEISLGEILRTTVVLIGYGFHYEAAICGEYLEREWGNFGLELLDMVISGLSDSAEKPRHYVRFFWFDPKSFSILCHSNLTRAERNLVIEATEWLCRAIRIPASSENLSVSSPSPNLLGSAVEDSKNHGDMLPGESEQEISFTLQGLSPLPESEELCWRPLFKSGVVAMRSCERKPPLSNKTSPMGLEVSFELMVQLSAVEIPVLIDDGIVLVGYQTALVPIFGSENFIQWHLETDEEGQINPYELNATRKEWLKKRDWESFKGMRCFVGWCSSAHINLGTKVLTDKVGWSDSKSQKRTLHWSGISLGCQATTSNPMQVGFMAQVNFSFVPNKVNFTPSKSFAKLLKDTSKQVAAVVDCLYDRSWIVPKLSLMLHMAHAWSARNSLEPDPIPFAHPAPDGGQAEAVLRDSGDIILLGQGQDKFTLRQLMLGLNVNLLQSRHQTEDAASGKIYGFEFMDIVCEPPTGGSMKKIGVKSPGKCWLSVVNRADAVVLCANLGQAITPVDENNERNPSCNIMPPGCGYLAVPLSCLTELIVRQGRQESDLNAKQDEAFKISDDYFWKISGNPFEDCAHSGQQIQTCWERENLLQKLTKRGGLKGMLKEGKQIRSCVHICPSGAVVFGERSVRMDIYSVLPLLGSEKSISSTTTVYE